MPKPSQHNEQYYFDGLTTPLGRIHIVATDKAIVRLYLPNTRWSEHFTRAPQHPLIRRAKKELHEYFSGKRKRFTLPLAPAGTAFQRRVWSVLKRIPHGRTVTYAEEAVSAGKGSAVRAVANANARNPIPILIPCHRVVRSNGTLGGYSGGHSKKRKLLAHERHVC